MKKDIKRYTVLAVKNDSGDYMVTKQSGRRAIITYDELLHSVIPSILVVIGNILPESLQISIEYEL